MGGEYKLLWKAARRAMLNWWMRTGIWLLAILVAIHVVNALSQWGFLARAGAPGRPFYLGMQLPADLALMVVWLWAATVCHRLLSGILEDHAAPKPAGYLRAGFLLAYAQGLVPLLIALVLGIAGPCLILARLYSLQYYSPGEDIAILLNELGELSVKVAWLVGLLVLVPRRPVMPWALLLAPLAADLVVLPAWLFAQQAGVLAGDLLPLFWLWGWPLSALIVLCMFYALRRGPVRLGYTCYGVLLGALLAVPALVYAVWIGQRGVVLFLAQLSCNIPRFLSESPISWWGGFLTAADETFPASETVLGYVAHLVPLIAAPLWLAAVLALLYYVILAPRREGSTE